MLLPMGEENLIARVKEAIEIIFRQPHLFDHVNAAQRRLGSALTKKVHSLNSVCKLLVLHTVSSFY